MSPDLADALDRDLDARRAFDTVSASGKQRLVLLPVEQAKTAKTRRCVARAVEELRAGRDRWGRTSTSFAESEKLAFPASVADLAMGVGARV